MSEINEIKEPTEEVNEKLSVDELIERYAKIQNISVEQAKEEIGAPTEEEVLKKKVGAKKYAEMVAESGDITTAVSETAAKLNYIDLIQKLRKLNKEKEENGTVIDEDN